MIGLFSLWTETPVFRLDYPLALLYSAAIAYGGRSYGDTELVTDGGGLELADRLGWNLTSYSLALQDFCGCEMHHIWMLGKLHAQRIQCKPFVHTDLDLLLYAPLPARMTTARVCAQSKDDTASYLDPFVRSVMDLAGLPCGTVPYNAALIGWTDLALRDCYISQAWDAAVRIAPLVEHGGIASIVCEQAMLGHVMRQERVHIETAIPMPVHVHDEDFEDVKFTHFWGRSKHDPDWWHKIETRFSHDFPEAYAAFVRGMRILEIKR